MARISADVLISVRSESLIDLRDTLIAVSGLVEATRMDTGTPNDLSLGTLLYVERELTRKAGLLSAWLDEYEQGKLPF